MNRSVLLLFTAAAFALAQPPSGGWRRAGDTQQPPIGPAGDPEPVDRRDAYGQPASPQQPAPPDSRPRYGLPAVLTLRPGTYLTVRLNQTLHSDQNRPGDTFVGSLAQPIVIDGVVVANRNQLVYGRVAEAERARSGQPSRLGLQLTAGTLADGSQVPLRSQLSGQQGGRTPTDVQFATVAGTTATGAAIGAIADWGTGAAIGAGVGAAAGLAGVMMTRNRPTILYPETVITFAVVEPLTISTANAPHAFRFVGPEDYAQPQLRAAAPRPRAVAAPYYYPPVSVVVGRPWGWGWGGWGRGGYGRYPYRGWGWGRRGWW